MKRYLAALLVLCLASPAWAARQNCPGGLISSAQAATGASTDFINPLGTNSLVVQFVRDGGTATGQVEICCTESCGASGDWFPVAGSTRAVDATTVTEGVGITEPACLYRTNLTACGTCDIDIFFRCGTPLR